MKNTIEKFYNAKSYRQPHQLECKIEGYNDTFSIDLIGSDQEPDCCIGHFGYNFYFRTNKGMKAQKYTSLCQMFKAIRAKAKKEGLNILSFGLKRKYEYRPILSY